MRVYILEWMFTDGNTMTIACKEYEHIKSGDLRQKSALSIPEYQKLKREYHNPVGYLHAGFRSEDCTCSYIKDVVELED